ncbi:MAG: hypothetical protein F6K34_06260 [Okeania sp. SIO4D6]|nr:hypothetical protein [Okeania sp. SIO4D6]NEP70935.1 hypothetical protein [Okeania sp. SIO2G5]
MGSNVVINEGEDEATLEATVEGSWEDTINWTRSNSRGVEVHGGFNLEVVEGGASYTVEITEETGGSQSESRSSSSTIVVKVPGKSKREVLMIGKLETGAISYEAQIHFGGLVGANFPKPVGPGDNMHYFWFADVHWIMNHVLDPEALARPSMLNIDVKTAHIFDVVTKIKPAEQL